MADGPTVGLEYLPHAIIAAFQTSDGNAADGLFAIADAIEAAGDKIAKAINGNTRALRSTRSTNGATEEVAVFNKPGD